MTETEQIIAIETGRRYCIQNKMMGFSISIYLDREDALRVMRKRYGTHFAEGDELVECLVTTQHGSLNIYNCEPVNWLENPQPKEED